MLSALFRRPATYGRQPPLVLINGLAEQAETWFRNAEGWRRHFDVHQPNILAYDGPALHRRIAAGLPITVDYLVEQLRLYLESFVQRPPYHLAGSSTGAKVAIEYAVRYPDDVARLVLFGPSGLGEEESLPVIQGVRRSDPKSVIDSVFFDVRQVDPGLVRYYHGQLRNRRWRIGLLKTIRGTLGQSVRRRLGQVSQPTLVIMGSDDRIVDPEQVRSAVAQLPRGQLLLIPRCGHAPHMEKARRVTPLVTEFLKSPVLGTTTAGNLRMPILRVKQKF
jgi:pimeloyl-ACP methyl ester carboxylesterase